MHVANKSTSAYLVKFASSDSKLHATTLEMNADDLSCYERLVYDYENADLDIGLEMHPTSAAAASMCLSFGLRGRVWLDRIGHGRSLRRVQQLTPLIVGQRQIYCELVVLHDWSFAQDIVPLPRVQDVDVPRPHSAVASSVVPAAITISLHLRTMGSGWSQTLLVDLTPHSSP